jgi:hypothetical protein
MTNLQKLRSIIDVMRLEMDNEAVRDSMPAAYRTGFDDALDQVTQHVEALEQKGRDETFTLTLVDDRARGGGLTLLAVPVRLPTHAPAAVPAPEPGEDLSGGQLL